MISLSPKGGTRASECIECREKFLFLYETSQIDLLNKKKSKNNKRLFPRQSFQKIFSSPFYEKSGCSFSENYY